MLKADVYHDAIHFLLLLFIIKTLLLAFVLESVIFVATSWSLSSEASTSFPLSPDASIALPRSLEVAISFLLTF